MARPRNKSNKGLPPNLYEGVNGHYKYRRPDTGKWHSIGKDRIKAISAARQLNSMLLSGRDLVEKIINDESTGTLNAFLDRFEQEFLPQRKLSETIVKDYKQKHVHIRKSLGEYLSDVLFVKEISGFLDQFPYVSSNRYRSFLLLIFRYAISKGVCKENPVEKTMPAAVKKSRRRLELDDFFAIYHHPEAKQWFKNVMDLGLQTLQCREDLVNFWLI